MGGSQDQFDRLRLIRSRNIEPVSYRQLIARFGTAKLALDALPDLVMRGGGKNAVIADPRPIEQEMTAVVAAGA